MGAPKPNPKSSQPASKAKVPRKRSQPSRKKGSPSTASSKRSTAGTNKSSGTKVKAGKPPRKFPANTLEDAIRIPLVIKQHNGGNPWMPGEVAKALELGAKGTNFWYLSASSRDYGFTVGSRDTPTIELAPTGRQFVYARSKEIEAEALMTAFLNIEVFKSVYNYYNSEALPELKYLGNTLESLFQIPPDLHAEFLEIYTANINYIKSFGVLSSDNVTEKKAVSNGNQHSIVVGEPNKRSSPIAFVIMPFSEKTERYSKGFFDEVLTNLITPAAVEAGFKVETAKRDGSDVIQSTIVNDLLNADLVIADLTDHNPNVLFELGLRMAFEKPIALIRAQGTSAIFDVDNMLRVRDYDPSLWKSTLDTDIPKLMDHIKAAWDHRDSDVTYMSLLKRAEI